MGLVSKSCCRFWKIILSLEFWSWNLQKFLEAESSVRLRSSSERWTETLSRDKILLCNSSRTVPDTGT